VDIRGDATGYLTSGRTPFMSLQFVIFPFFLGATALRSDLSLSSQSLGKLARPHTRSKASLLDHSLLSSCLNSRRFKLSSSFHLRFWVSRGGPRLRRHTLSRTSQRRRSWRNRTLVGRSRIVSSVETKDGTRPGKAYLLYL